MYFPQLGSPWQRAPSHTKLANLCHLQLRYNSIYMTRNSRCVRARRHSAGYWGVGWGGGADSFSFSISLPFSFLRLAWDLPPPHLPSLFASASPSSLCLPPRLLLPPLSSSPPAPRRLGILGIVIYPSRAHRIHLIKAVTCSPDVILAQ